MADELVTRENAQSRTCSLPECAHPKCHDARTIIALCDRAEQAEARVKELAQGRDRLKVFAESVPGPVQESDNIWYCKQEWCGGSYQGAEHIKHHRACLWVKAQEALKGTQ